MGTKKEEAGQFVLTSRTRPSRPGLYRKDEMNTGLSGGFVFDSVWKDLIGDIVPKTSGVGTPSLNVLSGAVRAFCYGAGDTGDCVYHIPHDWTPGTDGAGKPFILTMDIHYQPDRNGTPGKAPDFYV